MLLIVAAVVAAGLPATARADAAAPVDWSLSAAAGPGPRIGPVSAYDSGRLRTVLFGGTDAGYTPTSDTWEWDGTSWTQRSPATSPSPHALGGLTYDSARGVSVLFGGWSGSAYLNDTWEWDGSNWLHRMTATAPSPRVWFAMAYDATRHVSVVFGGETFGGQYSAETWEYDGVNWAPRSPAHSPTPRLGPALAYDQASGALLLFGGRDANGNRLNDTWRYDGSDWVQLVTSSAPSPRFFHSMAYDSQRQRLVLFGGDYIDYSSLGSPLGPSDQTWEFDGSDWTRRYVTTWPPARAMASMAYDSARSQMVLVGGTDEGPQNNPLGGTWLLSTLANAAGAGLSADAINFGQPPVLVSATRTISLVNSGSAPTSIYSITGGGDFSAVDTCPRAPATLAVGASCAINVSFTPTIAARQNGTLTVTDNADSGSQAVLLSGSGSYGFLQVSPGSLAFPPTGANSTSSLVETLTAGAQPTVISGFDASPPWSVTNLTCPLGSPMSYQQSCQIRVDFTPANAGTFSSQITIHDSEPGLQRTIAVSGEGSNNPATASFTVVMTAPDTVPEFSDTIRVTADISATSGTANFAFAGHQLPPVSFTNHKASVDLTLDDALVPAGAGTYPLTLAIQSTDPAVGNGYATTSITVNPDTAHLSWTGTTLDVAGVPATLSVAVSQQPQDPQPFDYADHAVFVRFDVTDTGGTTTTYFAQVQRPGTATVAGPALRPGAYLVRATLVRSPADPGLSPYLVSDEIYAAFAGRPAAGGYMAGGGSISGQWAGFEYEPGKQPTGSLRWVRSGQFTTADGVTHRAWFVASASSVVSVDSHSHLATATGTAVVTVRDATTDAVLSTSGSVGFEVDVASTGSTTLALTDGSNSASGFFNPGAAVDNL
ncbi:MAG TPA: kelch repeat-containing protein [Amycolatopsis sp.]|nr:kelch repeat-containing protein [Amycolatopsis sp.]